MTDQNKEYSYEPASTDGLGEFKIYDKNSRLLAGFVYVDEVDKEGHYQNFEKFVEGMEIYMRRGAPIIDKHTNFTCGRMLEYHIKNTPTGKKGIWAIIKIFNDSKQDTLIWKKILPVKEGGTGEYKSFSYGAKADPNTISQNGNIVNFNGVDVIHEFSICENGMVKNAKITNINTLAKSVDKMTNENLKKEEIVTQETVTPPEEPQEDKKDSLEEIKAQLASIMERLTVLEEKTSVLDQVEKQEEKKPEEPKEEDMNKRCKKEDLTKSEDLKKSDEILKSLDSFITKDDFKKFSTDLTKALVDTIEAKSTVKVSGEEPSKTINLNKQDKSIYDTINSLNKI
jgi:hypothetical protein